MNIRSTIQLLLSAFALLLLPACNDFVFGRVVVAEEDDPRIQHKIPRTKMDLYEAKKIDIPNLNNPDPNGPFANWASCYVMFKEGHDHGGGMMHGNYVYDKAPWSQEMFIEIFNRPKGEHPEIKMNGASINSYLENQRKLPAPNYIRVIAGAKRRWGMCLNFYDKEGQLLNDSILAHSKDYQIFYCISDLDDKGQPYDVLDVRWRGEGELLPTNEPMYPRGEEPVPAKFFKGKKSLAERQALTHYLFRYVYRDTWRKDDMADGVQPFFNIKLLPPLTRKDRDQVSPCDIDCIGLKGHFTFDWNEEIDPEPWCEAERIKESAEGKYLRPYTRNTHLLAHFYLTVRVLKRRDGNKLLVDVPADENYYKARGENVKQCSPFEGPVDPAGWDEIIRFNLPIRIFADSYDSDPTGDHMYEPFYVSLAKETRVPPAEAYELGTNKIINGNDGSGGQGYGSFFL